MTNSKPYDNAVKVHNTIFDRQIRRAIREVERQVAREAALKARGGKSWLAYHIGRLFGR